MEKKDVWQIVLMIVSGLIAFAALVVSIIALVSASNASFEANSISSQQLQISKNSNKPEFIYNGPRDMVKQNNEQSDLQPDDYYDYGFEPSFSRISGYASDLACKAHSHYDLVVTEYSRSALQQAMIDAKGKTWNVALDVYGEFPRSEWDNDRTALTVYLEETRAKVSPELLDAQLREVGFTIQHCSAYCVGELVYTDILDNTVTKPFSIDMQRKTNADFANSHANCAEIEYRIDYDWGAPSRGITTETYYSAAKDIASRIMLKESISR